MASTLAFKLACAALAAVVGAPALAQSQARRDGRVIVTRESQDFYRVADGSFYIKTKSCNEFVFNDRADIRLNIGARGGTLTFRNGRLCVIERFYKDYEPRPADLQDK